MDFPLYLKKSDLVMAELYYREKNLKNLLAPFLTPEEIKISVLLSASIERFGIFKPCNCYKQTRGRCNQLSHQLDLVCIGQFYHFTSVSYVAPWQIRFQTHSHISSRESLFSTLHLCEKVTFTGAKRPLLVDWCGASLALTWSPKTGRCSELDATSPPKKI